MQQVHHIQLLIMINIIELEGKLVKGRLYILFLQDEEVLDKTREWNLRLVYPSTQHKVKHLPKVWVVIPKNILQISDNVLLCQITTLLYKFRYKLLLQFFLIWIVIKELLKDRKELSIMSRIHSSS
jgi:hypothetical protein